MRTLILSLLASMVLLPAVPAQSASQLKADLRKQETDAGEDVTKLIELAKWAKEKGLINDYRRLLNKVVKIDPDNEEAYTLRGYVKFDGKWMTKSKANVLRRKKVAAEMRAKGFVEVDGVWVAKDEADDAKKGLFRHDGEPCTKAEKLAFLDGKVRHPATGVMIPADGLARAENGEHLVGDEWLSEADADRKHASQDNPWVVRSYHAWIVSALPLAKIREVMPTIDEGIESLQPLFGMRAPTPGNRPVVIVAADADQYRQIGEQIGSEGSSGYGCFLADSEIDLPNLGSVRPVVISQVEGWTPYFLRHGAGLAYANAHCRDYEAEVPLWFLRGCGSYSERFYNPGIAQWFGKQHLDKGGVKDVAEWMGTFEISGNLDAGANDFNIFQAGLVLAFCKDGGDDDATKALLEVTSAEDGKALTKALKKVEKTCAKKTDAMRMFLRQMTQS